MAISLDLLHDGVHGPLKTHAFLLWHGLHLQDRSPENASHRSKCCPGGRRQILRRRGQASNLGSDILGSCDRFRLPRPGSRPTGYFKLELTIGLQSGLAAHQQ
jgi:hypothetical protein